jgi:alkyl hydroperoxide reductase subunit AhpC
MAGKFPGCAFFHPADFTPVGTTQSGAMAKTRYEFDKRNVKVIAVSLDPLDSHPSWIKGITKPSAAR